MKRHLGEVWAAAALLAVPVKLALPPLVLAALVLLSQRATASLDWLPSPCHWPFSA
jgi:hypothetical protein